MNLQEYSPKSCGTHVRSRSAKPTIVVAGSGRIELNCGTANLIGVAAGDRVVLLQDGDKPKDWYIASVGKKDGFALRNTSARQSGRLIFNNTGLARTLLLSLSVSAATCRAKISAEVTPVELHEGGVVDAFAILTGEAVLKD